MRNTDFFQGKKVSIVGLARSGLACAELLASLGAQVCVSDSCDNDSTRLNASKLRSKNIKVELGGHTKDFILGNDLVVISPGVTASSPVVLMVKEAGIPVVSEIEVAALLCPSAIIAVTGSSGKTTVTTLIGKVLEAAGKKVFVCGNIGNPFSGEVAKMGPRDYVSLEVSSFQLEAIRSFKPKVAVILNLSRNHLDRHKDMQEYLDAKKRVFLNQDKDDFLVLNSLDPSLKGIAEGASPKVLFFNTGKGSNPNESAVICVVSIFGINEEVCGKVFAGFKGLEHRMEYVRQVGEVGFVNDSKATVAESTAWAIKNIKSPIILIAGGRDKGVDYTRILDMARGKVKQVIAIGEARPKIKQALGGELKVSEADTLKDAVSRAYAEASAGDCVLLSPMCSSFDMFKDYEERGRKFKEIVSALEDKT